MPRIDPNITVYKVTIDSQAKPVKKKRRHFSPGRGQCLHPKYDIFAIPLYLIYAQNKYKIRIFIGFILLSGVEEKSKEE